MRAVLQRATRACVSVDRRIVGSIDRPGLVVLLGITHDDGPHEVAWMSRKIRGLRIMHGEQSVADLGAPVLLISQFTLYGEARKGRRPTWQGAATSEASEPLYEEVRRSLEQAGTHVETGVFGADMAVELVNDGPFTLILDSAAG